MTDQVIVIQSGILQVVTQGAQGPRGPAGPSAEQFVRTAATNVGGHRMVFSDANGEVSHASNLNPAHLNKVLGLSLNAASAGDPVTVLRNGSAALVGWNWDESLPLYLADDGLLTQTPPASGYSLIVGFAETPTTVFVRLREPIILL